MRPTITYRASSTGSGWPDERFCGMPSPGGHCGQLMSAPSTGSVSSSMSSTRSASGSRVMVGAGGAASVGSGVVTSVGAATGADDVPVARGSALLPGAPGLPPHADASSSTAAATTADLMGSGYGRPPRQEVSRRP